MILQIQLTPAQLQAIQMQLQGKQGNQPIIIQSSEQPAVQTIQTVTQADQSQFGQVRNAEPNLCSWLFLVTFSEFKPPFMQSIYGTHNLLFMNFNFDYELILWSDLPGCVSDTTVT